MQHLCPTPAQNRARSQGSILQRTKPTPPLVMDQVLGPPNASQVLRTEPHARHCLEQAQQPTFEELLELGQDCICCTSRGQHAQRSMYVCLCFCLVGDAHKHLCVHLHSYRVFQRSYRSCTACSVRCHARPATHFIECAGVSHNHDLTCGDFYYYPPNNATHIVTYRNV